MEVAAADSTRTSQTLREAFLDLSQWPGFTGWGPLPGIRQANFLRRTDAVRGSRIAVINTDGSSHVEEILEWSEMDPRRFRGVIRLGEFTIRAIGLGFGLAVKVCRVRGKVFVPLVKRLQIGANLRVLSQ